MMTSIVPAFFDDTRIIAAGGLGLLAVLLIAIVWHDVRDRRVPNRIVFSGAALALFLHAMLPTGSGFFSAAPGGLGFMKALGGLAIGLAALLPLYLIRAAGAGDAKAMAMVGAFLGTADTLGAVFATYVAGALLALVFTLKAGTLGRMMRNVRLIAYSAFARLSAANGPSFDARADCAGKLPYTLAIALGTACWLASKQLGSH